MKIYQKNSLLLIILVISILGFFGCDMFSSVKGYFKEKKGTTPATVQTPAVQPQQPVQQAAEAVLPSNIPIDVQPKVNPPAGPLPANVAARIGAWTVSLEEIEARLKAEKEQNPEANVDINNVELKKAIRDVLIRQQLLVLDAEAQGVDKKKEILDMLAEARRTLLVEERVANIIGNVTVSDELIKQTYDQVDSPYFYEPLKVKISEIVVESQIKATELLLELQKEAVFADLAKQHSIGATAANGGDLGFITEPPFPKMGEIIVAMLQEEGNAVSTPFKGPQGFYIVKIDEKQGGEKKPFEAVKDFIKGQLELEQKDAAILEYLNQLQQKIKVEINEDLLK